MKIFVINLDRSSGRLAHMEGEFHRIGLSFERLSGVDGNQMAPAAIEDFVASRPAPGQWLPGEIGCFLSHMAAWRKLAEQDIAIAAIFEDDIHVAADLAVLLKRPDWIPSDADIVRLEANRPMVIRSGRRIESAPRRSVYRAHSGSWGSAGYIVTRHAAQALVRSEPRLHHFVDVFLFKPSRSEVARDLRRYQVAPAVCVQDMISGGSSEGLESLIGADLRMPKSAHTGFRLSHLLPWKKRPVHFIP